jgi:hypothetical protein
MGEKERGDMCGWERRSEATCADGREGARRHVRMGEKEHRCATESEPRTEYTCERESNSLCERAYVWLERHWGGGLWRPPHHYHALR